MYLTVYLIRINTCVTNLSVQFMVERFQKCWTIQICYLFILTYKLVILLIKRVFKLYH